MRQDLLHYRHAPCRVGELGYVGTFDEVTCEECKVLAAKMAALAGEDSIIAALAYYSEPEPDPSGIVPILPKLVISTLPGGMAGRLGTVRPDVGTELSGWSYVRGWIFDSQSFTAGTGLVAGFEGLTDVSFLDPVELLGHIRVRLLRIYETGWKPGGR